MKGLLVGFHVSISKSLDLAVDRASELGCTTFQMFTRNPRGWKYTNLDEEEVRLFREKRGKAGYGKIVVHMPYLPNLASPQRATMKRSRASLVEEVRRCGIIGADYLVVHLGSHLGKGSLAGVKNVSQASSEAIDANDNDTTILLETNAGKKNCVGARFEEIRLILDQIPQRKRVGVCFDTCHVFAEGFDLASEEAVSRTMGIFDDIVGLRELKVFHLNDSKAPLGSNTDRHEHIGMGSIGTDGFRALLRYPGVAERPFILETPMDGRMGSAEELRVVRSLALG